VVIEDKDHSRASSTATSHEADASLMLIERVHNTFARHGSEGLLVIDRPAGDRRDEERFLAECLEVLESGTQFVLPNKIAISVLSAPSKLVRVLQLADVVTSCTTAMVSGEDRHAPAVFEEIKPLFESHESRVAGVGLKLHPDFRYVNLYHWLLGESYYRRGNVGHPLPMATRPYAESAMTW
jgi:hypothetical protein